MSEMVVTVVDVESAQSHGACGSFKRQKKLEATWSKDRGQSACESCQTRLDPAEVFGAELLQMKILSLIDAQSLARCMMTNRSWRALASVDSLWSQFCADILTARDHLPLALLRSPHVPRYRAFAMTKEDIRQVELSYREACARTWEVKLKPICGSYWTGMDPTYRGGPPLRRYFQCDGSIEADPGDPLWGGKECEWKLVYPEHAGRSQHLQIHKWPVLRVTRTEQGRWCLENELAYYNTVPDSTTVTSLKERWRKCRSCGYV